MVKKYLRDHCDYTFETLKVNLPKVMESVPLHTICRWEHQVFQWMAAYDSGLQEKEAQVQVKAFSTSLTIVFLRPTLTVNV